MNPQAKRRFQVAPELGQEQVEGRLAALQQQSQMGRFFQNMSPTVMEANALGPGARRFGNVPNVSAMYQAAAQKISIDDSMAKRFLLNDSRQVFPADVLTKARSVRRVQNNAVDAPNAQAVIAEQEVRTLEEKLDEGDPNQLDQTTKQLVTLVFLGAVIAGLLLVMSNE